MKKIFLTVLSAFVLLASCNNLHFDDSTSVSMYLPSLNNQNNSSQDARLIDPIDLGIASDKYYTISLLRNGVEKYSVKSFGGETITLTGIFPDTYTVVCNACYSNRSKTVVYATGKERVSVHAGTTNNVDIGISDVPVIYEQSFPSQLFSVLELNQSQASFVFGVSGKSLGMTDAEIDSWAKYNYSDFYNYVSIYCDGKKVIGDNVTLVQYQMGPSDQFNFTYSFFPEIPENNYYSHEYYFEFRNKKNGNITKTDPVKIYFSKDIVSNPPEIVSYDVRYKGSTNRVDINDLKNIDESDFSATVKYRISDYEITVECFDLTNEYTYKSTYGKLRISHEDIKSYAYEYYYEPGKVEISLQHDKGISSTEWTTVKTFDFVGTFKFNEPVSAEPQNINCNIGTADFEIPYYYKGIYLYTNAEEQISPNENCQWYFCDEYGNIIRKINGANKIQQRQFVIDGLELDTGYYVCCELTYEFDTTYCSNASGNKKVIFTKPILMYNTGA